MSAAIIGAVLIFCSGVFAGLWLGVLLERGRAPEPDEHGEVAHCGEPPAGLRRTVTAWNDDFYLPER